MSLTLFAIAGPSKGAAFLLDELETSVGRDPANKVVLPDAAVSASHCILRRTSDQIVVRDLDPGNPSVVNGLPASGKALAPGDRLQIGNSTFVVTSAAVDSPDRVQFDDAPGGARFMTLMRREDVLLDTPSSGQVAPARLRHDLSGLMRVTAAIAAVRGLVALERPLIELIVDVVSADRGAVILLGDSQTDISSVVGWDHRAASARTLRVSRPVITRVLREAVGVIATATASSGAILAAPLVAFDAILGAIYLESDSAEPPFDEERLRLLMSLASVTAAALAYERQAEVLAHENRRLQSELEVHHHILGDSPAMRLLYRRIGRVAPSDATVLITGESGTGKELVARAIHSNSARARRLFVAINCAAITETLLESELFGHERGAFTGAFALKKGKLEIAEGGTVLLDEVGELTPALQAKLLRVLQEREFERVGGTRSITVDFRLIAATNRDLEQAIASGTFRRDLYYRLNVVSLAVPPLRERREDIPLLADYFARRHAAKAKRRLTGLSREALDCLLAYEWPGNVRELENAIERAVVLGSTELIVRDDLPETVLEAAPAAPSQRGSGGEIAQFHDALRQAKQDLILQAFEATSGSHNAAARLLGLNSNYLHRLIRNLNLKGRLKRPS